MGDFPGNPSIEIPAIGSLHGKNEQAKKKIIEFQEKMKTDPTVWSKIMELVKDTENFVILGP